MRWETIAALVAAVERSRDTPSWISEAQAAHTCAICHAQAEYRLNLERDHDTVVVTVCVHHGREAERWTREWLTRRATAQ